MITVWKRDGGGVEEHDYEIVTKATGREMVEGRL